MFLLGLGLAAMSWVRGAAADTSGAEVFLPIIIDKSDEQPLPTLTPTSTPTRFPTTMPTPTNTPTSTPTNTPKPTATPTSAPPGNCSTCAYDAYNCSDFSTQAAAQACYDYCMQKVGYDVHRLDANKDGIACESLPLVFIGWVFNWP